MQSKHPLDTTVWRNGRDEIIRDCLADNELAAKIYDQINFPCGFKDGVCAAIREYGIPMEKGSLFESGGCCSKCAAQVGYLRGYSTEEEVVEYKKYWDDKTGFLEPGKGCRLPGRLRSKVCMSWICDWLKENMSKEDLEKLDEVRKLCCR